jgi:hypothetical protein
MLTFVGGQVECLRDEALPVEVRELPEDLAGLDQVLADEVLLWPIAPVWVESARERGRPSIAMVMFVRRGRARHARNGVRPSAPGRSRERPRAG